MSSLKKKCLFLHSRKDLDAYLDDVNQSDENLFSKENELNFESLYSYCYPASVADGELWDTYHQMGLSEEEFTLALASGELKQYSEETYALINAGKLIEEQIEEKHLLNFKTAAPYYAKVLNKNNIVCINDTIFQYNYDEIKMITDGDFDKVKFFERTADTDLEQGIIVAKGAKYKDTYYTVTDVCVPEGNGIQGQDDNKKIILYVKMKHYDYVPSFGGTWYYVSYYTHVFTENRFLNRWWSDASDITVWGTTHRMAKWMGTLVYDSFPFSVSQRTNRSTGVTYKTYEGWSNAAELNEAYFAGNFSTRRDLYPEVLVDFSCSYTAVPSRWWNWAF